MLDFKQSSLRETGAPNVNSEHTLKSPQYMTVPCVCVCVLMEEDSNKVIILLEGGARPGE